MWEGHAECPKCEDTINIQIRHMDQMLYLSCGYCGHQDSCCEPYVEESIEGVKIA